MNTSTSLTSTMDKSSDSLDGEAAAAGSFFGTDYKRHDDLKQMLDSNRDNLKLEAMKRIIGMVAKGRDASELFPAVVKNVVSKNTEVKKLVYVYLVRYAEEQQELALLSIATFQRALKDPNQLIRASALRVLSSIRVSVIVPIVMLAIRDASGDMSPYVRKTAAHAIPKLYNLDPEQKEECIQILDKLLSDKTTLVVGSAMMAFEEVCPERIDLIHKNYRKLCTLLVDVDEWGQVVILNVLTRYARTQFVDPNLNDLTIEGETRPFYEDDENKSNSDSGDDDSKKQEKKKNLAPQMDSDHRLLLRNSKPLLQSRNAAVVMAVCSLYHHCAPKSEVHVVIRALIRLLRSHAEVQVIVLTSIAAMSTNRKALFDPYMKSFYVRSSDPTQIKLLKLEILTNIANEANIPPILREFQAYIPSQDKEFVAATIQAIGRCASNIKEVAETCLNGLVSLLSHPDPAVVGESVVVAKTLLQGQRSGNKKIIAQLAKMVDRVKVPPARAAILWLLGEHSDRIPNLPPDVLRKMAKTFPDEDDIVKLQIINLASKLQLTNPGQTTLLCQYILNLAKYDQSYDIRDRARFVKHLLFPENPNSHLFKYAKKILLSSKPAPILESKFKDRDFQLGSLSHFLNTKANGYRELPTFPEVPPDPEVRNVEPPPSATIDYSLNHSNEKSKSTKKKDKQSKKKRTFYSESESSGSGSGSGSSSSGTEDSESDSSSSSSSETTSGPDNPENISTESDDVENGVKATAATTTTVKSSVGADKNEKKVVHYNNSKSSSSRKKSESESSKNESSSSGSGSSSSDSDDSSSDSEPTTPPSKSSASAKNNSNVKSKNAPTTTTTTTSSSKKVDKKSSSNEKSKSDASNVDLLLDFSSEDSNFENNSAVNGSTTATATGQMFSGLLLSPSPTSNVEKLSAEKSDNSFESASPMFLPTKKTEVLNKIASGGLSITYRFTRLPHLTSSKMISIELELTNHSKEPLKDIRIGEKHSGGITVQEFVAISLLGPEQNTNAILGIDFNDTTQGAKIDILWSTEVQPKKHTLVIKSPIGELLRPISTSPNYFMNVQGKLRGMNEHDAKVSLNQIFVGISCRPNLVKKVYETANLLQVPSIEDDLLRFAGQSLSSGTLVLVTIYLAKDNDNSGSGDSANTRVVVNCEKMVIGSILLQELKEALK